MDRETLRIDEKALEVEVSRHIGHMPFVWIAIDDPTGPNSLRAYIEKNSIALLSNYKKDPLDSASPSWLGQYSNLPRIRESHLWNSDYIDAECDPAFLQILKDLIAKMTMRT